MSLVGGVEWRRYDQWIDGGMRGAQKLNNDVKRERYVSYQERERMQISGSSFDG